MQNLNEKNIKKLEEIKNNSARELEAKKVSVTFKEFLEWMRKDAVDLTDYNQIKLKYGSRLDGDVLEENVITEVVEQLVIKIKKVAQEVKLSGIKLSGMEKKKVETQQKKSKQIFYDNSNKVITALENGLFEGVQDNTIIDKDYESFKFIEVFIDTFISKVKTYLYEIGIAIETFDFQCLNQLKEEVTSSAKKDLIKDDTDKKVQD